MSDAEPQIPAYAGMTQESLPHRKIANQMIHAEGAIAYNDTKILGLGDSTCDSEQCFHSSKLATTQQ